MSSIDPELRETAVAQVQALNMLDKEFPGALQLVADGIGLRRPSPRRWAHHNLGGDGCGTHGVMTQMLRAEPTHAAPIHLLSGYEAAEAKNTDDSPEPLRGQPMAESKHLSCLAALQRTGTASNLTNCMQQSLGPLGGTAVRLVHGLRARVVAIRRERILYHA